MASAKENLKGLMTNARTRVIILFTAGILLLAFVVAYFKFFNHTRGVESSSELNNTPGDISSTPGALNQTAEYAKLQTKQNALNAQQALSKGTSSIPTLIDLKSFGDGVDTVGPQNGTGGLGFASLSNLGSGPEKPLWMQNLGNSNCSADTIKVAMAQGASIATLRESCSCEQLKNSGFNLNDLNTVCDCSQLRSLGYTVTNFKDIGFSPEQLKVCNFSACEMKGAGFDAAQMKNGGYSDDELKGAGFSPEAIEAASGLPPGVSADDVRKAGCSPENLEALKAKGLTAAAIRRISGCDVAQLKAAGFSAADLKAAGYSAAQLRAAGFNASQLKQAGFTPKELKNGGYGTDSLLNAGFSPAEIQGLSQSLPDGISPINVRNKGCNLAELKNEHDAGVSALLISKIAGCSQEALKAAGYTSEELKNAGLSPNSACALDAFKVENCDVDKLSQLKKTGVSIEKIQAINHCPAKNLKAAGYGAADLLGAGISPDELLKNGFLAIDINAGFTQIATPPKVPDGVVIAAACDPIKLSQLKRAGVTAIRIKALNKCAVSAFKNACFAPGQILAAGFNSTDLTAAGFKVQDIQFATNAINKQNDTSDTAIKAARCDATKIRTFRELGVTAARIEALNHCNASTIKQAHYCGSDLLSAGFSAKEMEAEGFSIEQIQFGQNRLAGLLTNQCPSNIDSSDAGIKAAGCDPSKLSILRKNGVSAARIMQMNQCELSSLKASGFTADNLLAAGTNPTQLSNAGFSPEELSAADTNPIDALAQGRKSNCSIEAATAAKKAGITADILRKNMGCSAQLLSQLGFIPKDLKNAGFTVGELSKAGLTVPQLLAAGFSPSDLKAAGYSANDLKDAGVNAADLLRAGFKPDQLMKAGYTAKDLLDGGLSPEALKKLGFNTSTLRGLGLTASQLKAAGFSPDDLKAAGFADDNLQNAGTDEKDQALAKLINVNPPPTSSIADIPGVKPTQNANQQGLNNLNTALQEQKKMEASLKFQQKIQQKTSDFQSYATQLIQGWKEFNPQVYMAATKGKDKQAPSDMAMPMNNRMNQDVDDDMDNKKQDMFVKTGDILFAVIDTSVNTDEPSPILATIATGPLKGAKLIGSFNLPSNASKMIITFSSMSIPGISKTIGISAYAIDPNTGRTALSSSTDHHYLQRYGSLFASTFLEGFGNAFQSADTTIQIGGTGGVTNTSVQNGVGRSLTSNAVIGLATVGKSWGQQAQRNMNVPTTVQVYSGTPIGVLFLQDIVIDPNESK